MFSVFDDEFHYIRRGDGKEELFAYRVDPGELTDLARTAAGRQKVEELRTGLVATWTMAGVESRR